MSPIASVLETDGDGNGALISNSGKPVPADCSAPGHAIWLIEEGSALICCHDSDNLAEIPGALPQHDSLRGAPARVLGGEIGLDTDAPSGLSLEIDEKSAYRQISKPSTRQLPSGRPDWP